MNYFKEYLGDSMSEEMEKKAEKIAEEDDITKFQAKIYLKEKQE